jgi:hypothetical protein
LIPSLAPRNAETSPSGCQAEPSSLLPWHFLSVIWFPILPLSTHIRNIIIILSSRTLPGKKIWRSRGLCVRFQPQTGTGPTSNLVIQEFATWGHSFTHYILAGPCSKAHPCMRSPHSLKSPPYLHILGLFLIPNYQIWGQEAHPSVLCCLCRNLASFDPFR